MSESVNGGPRGRGLTEASRRGGEWLERLEGRVLLSGDRFVSDVELSEHEVVGPRYFEVFEVGGGEIAAHPNSWVVTFDRALGADAAEARARAALEAAGLGVESVEGIGSGYNASFVIEERLTLEQASALTLFDQGIRAVEPDAVYLSTALPDDQFFSDQWGFDNNGQFIGGSGFGVIDADIDATDAWDITTGSSDVIIAVIDTGVDIDHPDLIDNLWTNPGEIAGNGIDDDGNGFVDDTMGWDFGELDNNPDDDAPGGGHGTAVAGTIGAVGNNGVGVAGLAWDVSILPIKIANRFGGLSLSAIVGAHDYLTTLIGQGYNIVASNNSYGAFAPAFFEDQAEGFIAERQAIERFIDADATFVAAAGNESNDNDAVFTSFPASYNVPGIISVAATNNSDGLSVFSNFGAETVDLGAPGSDIYTTTVGGGYGFIDGTSFSSPIVAGAVALLKTVRPDASAVEILDTLIDSSDPLPALQGRVVSGGRLNIARALDIIGRDGPIVTRVDPGPITGQLVDGGALNTFAVEFNKNLDAALLDPASVALTYAGADEVLGTGDDQMFTVTSVSATAGDAVQIVVDLTGQPLNRLPLGNYTLTLAPAGFKDASGNFLNGDGVSGEAYVHAFEVVSITGSYESNDTLETATPVVFSASGQSMLTGITLGDSVFSTLDVDIFAVTVPRGGLIHAEVFAKRRTGGSDLDGYLRLFDASGTEIANNDQFFGDDPLIDYFVTTGGTYYVAVSGFGNPNYNPEVAGSGSGQSTGLYDLELSVELVGDDRIEIDRDLSGDPARVPAQGSGGGGVAPVTSTLAVEDARQLLDVNLSLDITHTFIADLRITLTSPAGTVVTVFNGQGGTGENIVTLLDDESLTTLAGGSPPYTGTVKPNAPLSGFDGESALGTWTLAVYDEAGLNSGQLNGWGLELTLANNIFGPFESNDTPTTAFALEGVDGTGSASVIAEIGDGGYGAFDRDFFSIQADAGSTLVAAVTSLGPENPLVTEPSVAGATLNSALRLFDANGTEIKLDNPGGTLNSGLSQFVFNQSGRYFLAVSETGNAAYDPFAVGEGSAGTTTGRYQLTVAVSPGVGEGDVFLDGSMLDVGIGADGTFTAPDANGQPVGLAYNGSEVLFEDGGLASAFLTGTAEGDNFLNDGFDGATSLPMSLSNESDPFNNRVNMIGQFSGLRVQRTVSYGVDDGFLAIDLALTNNTTRQIENVAFAEGFNPDQGLNTELLSAATANDIAGNYASASFVSNQFPGGFTVGLGAPSADGRVSLAFVDPSFVIRDPRQLLDFVSMGEGDPNGMSGDQIMTIAVDFGSVGPGDTVTARYFVLFDETPAGALGTYNSMNSGSGEGHLTPSSDQPATEALSDGSAVPTLPYRSYYPDGFASGFISTFVPMINPHAETTRVVLIARYETGQRDAVLADITLEPNARGGVTVSTPDMYMANTSAVRPDEPYALEIRSERPVGAMFSHYDTLLLGGVPAAVGEAFTAQTSQTWTFSEVVKGASGVSDFILFQNTSDETIKITTTLIPTDGSEPIVLTQEVEAFRRGGINFNTSTVIPDGTYGVVIAAAEPIVAALTHFDRGDATGTPAAYGAVGAPARGFTAGVSPEGQFGLNATSEFITVLNPNSEPARVVFSFQFNGGNSYRAVLELGGLSQGELDVSTLPNFPVGTAYGVLYESDVPVTVTMPASGFGDAEGSVFVSQAYTVWSFGEGYRPPNEFADTVNEYLRVFNPNQEDVLVEITLSFDGGLGVETFRRTIPARQVVEFDLHDFVTGDRRESAAFFGVKVQAAQPVVAYMGHFDAFFPGAFGTMGSPFGTTLTIG